MAGSNITAVRLTSTGAISAGPVRLFGMVELVQVWNTSLA